MTGLFDVSGRKVLVTGGSSGIGRMIADGFAKAGAAVWLTSREGAVAERTAVEIGGACHGLAAELSTLPGVRAAAAAIERAVGSLDILVNNAGAQWVEPIDSFSEEGWDTVLNLNLKSVFFLTQALLPAIRRAASPEKPGAIINIGSIGGLHVSHLEYYSYAASKAALHHLTRALAKRLAGEHITVNAIAPGPFPSRMMEDRDDAYRAAVAAQTPLGRMGAGEDISGTAIYLASRAGAYVTGTVIPVDGGIMGAL